MDGELHGQHEDMATERAKTPSAWGRGTAYTVARSVVTPYWPYTAYVMAYAAFGMGLAAVYGSFDAIIFAAAMVAIWFGLEGLHALDLADEGVATQMNNTVAYTAGALEVAIGVAVSAYIVWQTTIWFLPLVVVGTVLGLAYNLEWFGGLLHDRDRLTGLANFGVSWGGIPFLGGYIIVHHHPPAGAVLVALGVCLDAIRLNYLEGHGRLSRYDLMGIEHDRNHKTGPEEARAACNKANVINLGAWAFIGAGVVALFVL